jgi:hypothetical protein
MMVAMVGRPPDRATLDASRPRDGEKELERSARLVRPVGEVAVITSGQHEHAHEVQSRSHDQVPPVEGHHQHAHDGDERQPPVWNRSYEIEPFIVVSSVPHEGNLDSCAEDVTG